MEYSTNASLDSSLSGIAVLSASEIEAVSGAAGSGANPLTPLGNLLYGIDVGINQILNTPLVSSVGQTFNKFGFVGQAIHFVADTAGYIVFKDLEILAKAIGGPATGAGLPAIPYHYSAEWGLNF